MKHKGSFRHTENFITKALKLSPTSILEKYGKAGVYALQSATPVATGLTASSWYYRVEKNNSGYSVSWFNSNVSNGIPIVILLQYGHGTRGGTYVQGRDFINPALAPIFEQIAADIWKEVTA